MESSAATLAAVSRIWRKEGLFATISGFSFAAADDQLAQAVKNIAAAMAQIGEKV